MKRKIISQILDASMVERGAKSIEEKDQRESTTHYWLLPTHLQVAEAISFVCSEWRRQKLPLAIFILLCVNLLVAPAIYAAADGTLESRYAYAIGLLGLVVLGLVVYLFFVVFQPERF